MAAKKKAPTKNAARAKALAKKLGGWLNVEKFPGYGETTVELVTEEEGTIWSDGSGAHTLFLANGWQGQPKGEMWEEVCDGLEVLLAAGVHPEPDPDYAPESEWEDEGD